MKSLSFSQGKRVCFEPIKELEVQEFDQNQKRFIKVKIQVAINNGNLIMFSYKNQIIRKAHFSDFYTNIDMFENIEQIKYLEWQGEYGPTQRRQGKWIATWKGIRIIEVGGYYQDDIKMGLWKQPITNYGDKAKVYESGEYFEDQKCGRWNYIYKDAIIGGGSYDERQNGIKIGKWIELHQRFHEKNQVFLNGEYKNGKKVGLWDINFINFYNKKFSQIGGGSYDDRGDGLKIGRWIELDEGFSQEGQIIHRGEYVNGKKVGIWDIYFNGIIQKIGGGSYDNNGDGIKLGKWIELEEGFYNYKLVVHNGEYKNSKKVGNWDIYYRSSIDEEIQKIGGGSYDDRGDGIKVGSWIELDKGFFLHNQLIYNGQYTEGKKFGRWDLKFRASYCNQFRKFGGGSYDKSGDGVKIGNWVDLYEGFSEDCQLIYNGEYQNGKKVGRWDIKYRNNWCQQFSEMCKTNYMSNICVSGGGIFEAAENECKQGNWVEILNVFNKQSYAKYKGEYKDDKRIGQWDILVHNNGNDEKIGGGLYDQLGNETKLGQWNELSDDFNFYFQTIDNGEYRDGKKVGVWVHMYRGYNQEKGFKIGHETKYEI
ncbi:unnamed protein product [Paramecium octaurelia]|uniref:Uncharacterized protein n=1 Tax=Paramecium octaurelia TaxID=43137 RepID=A0A8S1VP08_PAROT|nr:unnamed protein product [Paramecium octaurelia]